VSHKNVPNIAIYGWLVLRIPAGIGLHFGPKFPASYIDVFMVWSLMKLWERALM
jgi:hypothetical protein